MNLDKKLSEAISKQIVAEYYSAYLYLAMSAYCQNEGYKGFANWMNVQAQEELAHGSHMYRYLLDRGEVPQLGEIQAPTQDFAGLAAVFTQALAHEQHVTASIGNIATLAMQAGDHATYTFILWFVSEQVEEEASAGDVLQQLKMIGDNPATLYALDKEMATRIFVNPFPQ